MRTLRIGVMPREAIIQRTIAIAKGEYTFFGDEPTVWYESIEALAEVILGDTVPVLQLIRKFKPESIEALENLDDYEYPGDLQKLLTSWEAIGIIKFEGDMRKLILLVDEVVVTAHF